MPIIAWLKNFAASVGGRLFLGFTAFAGLFWLQFDPKLPPAEPEKIFGVLVAVGAWVWAELLSMQTTSHAGDIELMNKLRVRFDDNARAFLRDHNFGDSFSVRSLGGFQDFDREWVGAAYEFHDKRMQAALVALRDAVGDFDNSLAMLVRPVTGNPALMTTMTVQDANNGQRSAQTLADIKGLNVKAQTAINALDHIERLAKDRLRA